MLLTPINGRICMIAVLLCSLLLINCSKDTDLFEEISKYDPELVNEDSEETPEEEIVPDQENAPDADFEYNSFELGYNDASLWYDQSIIKIGGIQGGVFTYEANNNSQGDGGLVFDVPNRSGKLVRYGNHN